MKLVILLVVFLIPAAMAADQAPRIEIQKAGERGGLQGLLDEMWSRLRQVGPKLSTREIEKTTVVAGVRGAESTTSTLSPYWKGDKTKSPAHVAEVSAFNGAQMLAERDDYPAASAAFERFIKDYPNSTFKPNAEFGLALAISGMDREKGLAQLRSFTEKNRTHPFAADAQRVISQLEKAR